MFGDSRGNYIHSFVAVEAGGTVVLAVHTAGLEAVEGEAVHNSAEVGCRMNHRKVVGISGAGRAGGCRDPEDILAAGWVEKHLGGSNKPEERQAMAKDPVWAAPLESYTPGTAGLERAMADMEAVSKGEDAGKDSLVGYMAETWWRGSVQVKGESRNHTGQR